MNILTCNKVAEIFCIADDFCKEFEKSTSELLLKTEESCLRRNRKCSMIESEIIAIPVCFHI